MDKAHALALMQALESQQVAASAVMAFPGGIEAWTVNIDPSVTLSGVQLVALTDYCGRNGLTVQARFDYLGIF